MVLKGCKKIFFIDGVVKFRPLYNPLSIKHLKKCYFHKTMGGFLVFWPIWPKNFFCGILATFWSENQFRTHNFHIGLKLPFFVLRFTDLQPFSTKLSFSAKMCLIWPKMKLATSFFQFEEINTYLISGFDNFP